MDVSGGIEDIQKLGKNAWFINEGKIFITFGKGIYMELQIRFLSSQVVLFLQTANDNGL